MAKKKTAKPAKSKSPPAGDVAPPDTAAATSPPRRTFQSFQPATVRRSQLQLHHGNPRIIDKSARKRLREAIRRTGLVEGLVVNRWTVENQFTPEQAGTLSLVGGHQRISCMDEIRGYPDAPDSDYDVPINLIEVTLGREKELVVSLNNPTMQGQWDLDLLEQIIASPEVDALATGFDRRDLGLLFDQGVLDGVFGVESAEQAAAEQPVIQELVKIAESSRPAKQTSATGGQKVSQVAAGNEQDVTEQDDTPALTPEQQREQDVAGMKERRKDYVAKSRDANESEFMLVLVADTGAELDAFMQQLGLPTDNRYLALADFQDALAGA